MNSASACPAWPWHVEQGSAPKTSISFSSLNWSTGRGPQRRSCKAELETRGSWLGGGFGTKLTRVEKDFLLHCARKMKLWQFLLKVI